MPNYSIEIIREESVDPEDDNVDVYVNFEDGRTYFATFFTLRNIQSIMEKDRRTGESLGGMYFWASDMIIVERLNREVITLTIDDLIAREELERIFHGPLPPES